MALLGFVIAVAIGWLTYSYFSSPLRRIPGPLLAKFTDLQRFLDTAGGRVELTHRLIHAKYGPVVRIGPNTVSLSDPQCIKSIYSNRANFLKSEFYSVNDIKQNKQLVSTLFGTRDNALHQKLRAPIQKYYKLSTLLTMEDRFTRVLEHFCTQLETRFVNTGQPCDIAQWFLFYTWDTISEVTFSKPIKEGFLKTGGDIDDLLCTAEKTLDYFAVVGQIPSLDFLLDKNPVRRIGPPTFQAAANFCVSKLVARLSGEDVNDTDKKDFLDFFIEIKNETPGVTDGTLVGWMMVNIVAGADTTATTLCAIAYYLLKNPRTLKKLQKELDTAQLKRPVAYSDVSALPYLDAVIKEALRIHPSIGMLLERVVPAGGLALPSGHFLPQGTIVGMNACVVNLDKTVFGPDAECFNPDRWLPLDDENEDAYNERVKLMKDVSFTFGAGKRVCLGKELSLFETYKTIATIFSAYDFVLQDPKKEWEVTNSFFMRESGIDVFIKPRAIAS